MVVNRNLTLDLFLQQTGATEGYAKIMFTDMYNSIFAECRNIEKDYELYYQLEYEDIRHYLRKRYNVMKDDVEKIIEIKKRNPNYTIIAYDSSSSGNGCLDSLMFENKLVQRIENILLNEHI